ncbi:Neprosin [Dillenia turbinata]|uniref:Neprosin n=1 Tax=Dillenia turbinata TaxID=194707 RepID=A0AAN8VKY9_9MAGN
MILHMNLMLFKLWEPHEVSLAPFVVLRHVPRVGSPFYLKISNWRQIFKTDSLQLFVCCSFMTPVVHVRRNADPLTDKMLAKELEKTTKNWWVLLQGIDLGYWAASLFTDLSDSATYIQWGGEIWKERPNGRNDPNGKRSFAKASFFSPVAYMDASDNFVDADPKPTVTNPSSIGTILSLINIETRPQKQELLISDVTFSNCAIADRVSSEILSSFLKACSNNHKDCSQEKEAAALLHLNCHVLPSLG